MGFGLKMGGYISSVGGNTVTQPQSAIEAIHSMQFWPTIIASLIGIVLMLFYRLDGKTMEKVHATRKTSLDKGTQRKTTENELPSLTQCTA